MKEYAVIRTVCDVDVSERTIDSFVLCIVIGFACVGRYHYMVSFILVLIRRSNITTVYDARGHRTAKIAKICANCTIFILKLIESRPRAKPNHFF